MRAITLLLTDTTYEDGDLHPVIGRPEGTAFVGEPGAKQWVGIFTEVAFDADDEPGTRTIEIRLESDDGSNSVPLGHKQVIVLQVEGTREYLAQVAFNTTLTHSHDFDGRVVLLVDGTRISQRPISFATPGGFDL